jgi:hypothetical protein
MPLTTIDIAWVWGRAFASDRLLMEWAETHYGRAFSVSIGEDMRRPLDADKAPFISLFPDTSVSGPQRASITHELGFVAGIADDGWIDENGLVQMRGLLRLGALCPLLENAMRMALPKARVQEVTVEYEIVEFPLLMALASVTVEESLPVGRR